MKKQSLKCVTNLTLFVSVLFLGLMASCADKDLYTGGGEDGENGSVLKHFFDFATVQDVAVSVDYKIAQQSILKFYDVNPIMEDENHTYLTETEPLAIALTDGKGKYEGTLTFPSSVTTVYVYAENYFMPTVLTGTVSNKTLTVDTKSNKAMRAAVRAVNKNITKFPEPKFFSLAGNQTVTWNTATGALLDQYKAAPLSDGVYNTAKAVANAILKEQQTPTKFMMSTDYNTDLKKNEADAKITVSYILGASSSVGTLAYYTYTGSTPTVDEIAALPKCVIFANTKDENYGSGDLSVLKRNTSVELKYIQKNENGTGTFTDTWPTDAKIGFVLYNNGFNGDGNGSFRLNDPYFSTPIGGKPMSKVGNRHFGCCSTLSYTTVDGKNEILLGFEDWASGTLDYNDVVLHISGVYPTVEIKETERIISEMNKGVLGFEDNWPARGDYDMNDVVVKYSSTRNFKEFQSVNIKTATDGAVTAEVETHYYRYGVTDELTLAWTGANYSNGFAYELTLDKGADMDGITISKNGGEAVKATVTKESDTKCIVYVFNDAKAELNVSGHSATNMPETVTPVTYTIQIPYVEGDESEIGGTINNDKDLKYSDRAPYNPFIFVRGNKEHEVHLIDKAPTSVGKEFCATKFGKEGADTSDGISTYYRSSDYFPYAINLSADGNNNSSVWNIDLKPEQIAIYETYPKFVDWATTGNNTIKWWEK